MWFRYCNIMWFKSVQFLHKTVFNWKVVVGFDRDHVVGPNNETFLRENIFHFPEEINNWSTNWQLSNTSIISESFITYPNTNLKLLKHFPSATYFVFNTWWHLLRVASLDEINPPTSASCEDQTHHLRTQSFITVLLRQLLSKQDGNIRRQENNFFVILVFY